MRRCWYLLLLLVLFAGCAPPPSSAVQGYVEGEYVYVSSAVAGTLEALHVVRGGKVKEGDGLFELESVSERAAREEAAERLSQARATLEDLRKGRRPSEIESVRMQLEQARAALGYSEKELLRQQELRESGAISQRDYDRALSVRDQDRSRVAQLAADIETSQLASRDDVIVAAEANVRALEAALARTEWTIGQKKQSAPAAGVVFDTLFREGEWVGAGRPVVAILPPENIKIRAFVPETRIGSVHVGDSVRVMVDGVAGAFLGKVSFISPQAEFTPPVIYSRENRAKLVFMIEATFDPETAAKLNPGQPVDVEFGS